MQNSTTSSTASSVARFGFMGTPAAAVNSAADPAVAPFGALPLQSTVSYNSSNTSSPALASAPLCFAPSTVPIAAQTDYNNSSGEANASTSALLTKQQSLVNGNNNEISNHKNGYHSTTDVALVSGGQYKSLLPGFLHHSLPAATAVAARTNCTRQLSSGSNQTTTSTSKLPHQQGITSTSPFNHSHSSSSSSSSIVKSARSLGQISAVAASELAASVQLTAHATTNWSSPLASTSESTSLLPSLLPATAVISSSAAAALQPASSLTFTRSRTKSLETPPSDIAAPLSPYSRNNGGCAEVPKQIICRSTSSSTSSGIGGICSSSSRQVAHLNGTSLKQPSFLATSSLHQLNITATSAANTSAIPMKMSASAASSTTMMATNGTIKMPNHRLIKSQSLRFDSSTTTNQQQTLNGDIIATTPTSNVSANNCLRTTTATVGGNTKLSVHKSLDTVDRILQQLDNSGNNSGYHQFSPTSSSSSSKLPRSFTMQPQSASSKGVATTPTVGADANDEPLSDRLTTPGTLSRSSTASLGVLNTLNEILAAAEDGLEEDKVFDLVAEGDEAKGEGEQAVMGAKLEAIDESLSPLPPLTSIVCFEQAKEKVELVTLASEDPDYISLNSVEFEEEEDEEKKLQESKEPEKAQKAESKEQVSKPASKCSKVNPPTVANQISSKTNTFTKLPSSARKSTFPNKFNGGGSSKGSSVNASRTSTPTLSESEFGASATSEQLNSLSSANSAGSLHKAVTSKLSKTTSEATPGSRLGLKRTLPITARSAAANQTIDGATFQQRKALAGSARKNVNLNATDCSNAAARSTISRSSTYTRALNTVTTGKLGSKGAKVLSKGVPTTASQLSTKGTHKGPSSSISSTSNTTGTSFAKPTTSSTLKKSTAAATAPVLKRASSPATHHHQLTAKRPSSVASNCSSVASSNYSAVATPRLLQHQQKNSVRTPLSKRTVKPIVATTGDPSKLAGTSESSRRSSVTSGSGSSSKNAAFGTGTLGNPSSPHTAHKQTTTEQLRQYQALYWQQTETLKRYRLEHCRATLKSSALLAVFGHLINEYSPFETPSLRRELHSLHAKCCKLNRDYELSKEASSQKDEIILRLEKRFWEQGQVLDATKAEVAAANEQMTRLEQQLAEGVLERGQLEERVAGLRQELEAEKEEHSLVLAKLTALEANCRSDRKYRDLKEKINNYQKEVDSLNVVLEMKAQRNRSLETEQMRMQMELANYESLKETYQNLRRENEALAETVSLKARKNAEHAREIDNLRASLKKEQNERKRVSTRNDQLEYKLNETMEMLHTMSMSEMIGEEEEEVEKDEEHKLESGANQHDQQNSSFVPLYYSSISKRNNGGNGHHFNSVQKGGSRTVRRLFSTPGSLVTGGALSTGGEVGRQHFQHQEPSIGDRSHHDHRAALPELVLSSIGGSSQWSSSGPSSAGSTSSSSTFSSQTRTDSSNNGHNNHHHNHHHHHSSANSSPLNSPKLSTKASATGTKQLQRQMSAEKTLATATPPSPSSVQVPTSTTTD